MLVSTETMQKYIKIQLVYVLQYLRDASLLHANIPDRMTSKEIAVNILSIGIIAVSLTASNENTRNGEKKGNLPPRQEIQNWIHGMRTNIL